jgi:hypothetical protein
LIEKLVASRILTLGLPKLVTVSSIANVDRGIKEAEAELGSEIENYAGGRTWW